MNIPRVSLALSLPFLGLICIALFNNAPIPATGDAKTPALNQTIQGDLDAVLENVAKAETLAARNNVRMANNGDGGNAAMAAFWRTVGDVYEEMRVREVELRHAFLLNAVVAASAPNAQERYQALFAWAERERSRIPGLWLSAEARKAIDVRMKVVDRAIANLGEETGPTGVTAKPASLTPAFEAIRAPLERARSLVRSSQNAAKPGANAPSLLGPNHPVGAAFWVALTSILSFIAFLPFPSRNKKTEKKEAVPAAFNLKQDFNNATNDAIAAATPVRPIPRPAGMACLEEAGQAEANKQGYLFETTGVPVHSRPMSPVSLDVKVDNARLRESLAHVWRGAHALTNGARRPVTHVEWGCQRFENRMELEIHLVGSEIGMEELQRNAHALGDGSAVAHFGRAERMLEGLKPAVRLTRTNGRTTVRLAMESTPVASGAPLAH